MVAPTGPTGPTGPFLPTGPPFAAAGDLVSTGPTGATGPAGGTVLASELRQAQTTTLDRGYEPPQTMNYATIELDAPVVFGVDGPPPIMAGIDAGLAFAVALVALLLARRLKREGVRLLALVLVVGPIVAVVV
jgi:hypothetical protein